MLFKQVEIKRGIARSITYSNYSRMKKLLVFLMLILVILPLEIYCSEQAYFTMNWLISGLFYGVSYTTVFLSILFLIIHKKGLSMAVLGTGLLAIVPYNLYCANDLQNLKKESAGIVHWIYRQKLETHTFPKTISSRHDSRITYTREGENGFTLFFYVTTPNTGHFYTLKDGWCYMDD
jgi:hypothetical protein